MIRLPVSGIQVPEREPDGLAEMLLHEAAGGPLAAAFALVARLYGEEIDAPGLTVTDFEFLLLHLRAARLGQTMTLGFTCPHCRALDEVSFRIGDYVAGARPRPVPGVAPDGERAGWFVLDGAAFRLPTAGDQAQAASHPRPGTYLATMCMDETARSRGHRRRVERAMEAMAPALSREIAGECAECHQSVRAQLWVVPLVVSELKRAAGAVHDEVDLIARAYHWPESLILALPQPRRRAYAERIRRAQLQAA
jgi:hypothetical protein